MVQDLPYLRIDLRQQASRTSSFENSLLAGRAGRLLRITKLVLSMRNHAVVVADRLKRQQAGELLEVGSIQDALLLQQIHCRSRHSALVSHGDIRGACRRSDPPLFAQEPRAMINEDSKGNLLPCDWMGEG